MARLGDLEGKGKYYLIYEKKIKDIGKKGPPLGEEKGTRITPDRRSFSTI